LNLLKPGSDDFNQQRHIPSAGVLHFSCLHPACAIFIGVFDQEVVRIVSREWFAARVFHRPTLSAEMPESHEQLVDLKEIPAYAGMTGGGREAPGERA